MLEALLLHATYQHVDLPAASPAIYTQANVEVTPNSVRLVVHPRPTLLATGLYAPGRGYWPVHEYTDCVYPHKLALPRYDAWKWTCAWLHNNVYLLGHNPGQFTPLSSLRVGEVVYLNGRGYRVVSRQVVAVSPNNWWPVAETATPVLTIDMCADPAGVAHLVIRAVPE